MKSSDYWRQREHAHIAAMRGKDAEYDKQLTMFYANTEKSIQKEIDAFYGKYALQKDMTLAEAKKKVSQMDVQAFSEKAKRYVEEKNFSDQANEELKLYNATMKINRLELLKSEIGLECASLGNDLEKYAGDTLTDEAKAEAQRQAGILGTTLDTFDAKYMKEVVTGSYTDATFSDRIWGNNESLKHNLDTLLTQAIIGGKHPDVLARQLQKQFGTSQYEARRLMRTESSRIQGQIAVDSYKEGGIEEYEWVAEPTACEICKPLDGKRWKVNGAETGNKEHPMFPMHPNCRCAVIPVVDENEYSDWINHLDRGGTTKTYLRKRMDEAGVPDTGLHEVTDVKEIIKQINLAKASQKHGGSVDTHTEEELSQYTNFLSKNKKAGVSVEPDGDITSVFKNTKYKERHVVQDLILTAREKGGTKMDCFGKRLTNMYEQCGYEAVVRIPFNPDEVSDKELLKQKPDVYVMMKTPQSNESVIDNIKNKTYNKSTKEHLDSLKTIDDYMEALSYRDKLLEARIKRAGR